MGPYKALPSSRTSRPFWSIPFHQFLAPPHPAPPPQSLGVSTPGSRRPLSFPSTALTTLFHNCLSPPLDWEQGEGGGQVCLSAC